ncbi:MAG: protein kinase [Planctomycetota bacterium]|nr:protein kinase [Planctomycetota bacterium]
MTLNPDEMRDDETGVLHQPKPDHSEQHDDGLTGDVTELRPSPASQRREKSEDAPGFEVTVGDTLLTPDPGATVDSVGESFDDATIVSPESAGDGLDETFAPGADASMTIDAEWAASLNDDVEPEHTIKAPAAADGRGSVLQPTITLKRRNVSEQRSSGGNSDAPVNADADYQIEKLLGEGGMGAVYSARQQSMDRPVAIKVLKSGAAQLENSQEAFVSEAIITGGLDHPNIVPIYDVGKQPNDAIFYAMKQVVGVEWKERFATNTVSENLDILLRVCDAIAFAHARGIIHRDLKPANIMLGPFGEVLVMDWGLAMPTKDHLRRESFPAARAGGTPNYMAPEMVDGTEHVDRRSDVYLLGAILFEIVTGKPPHALASPPGNKRERVLACLAAVANNVIVETDNSGELLDIARKAIATRPADRYQTVAEFQAALREYLTHEESIELSARAYDRLAAGRQSGEYTEFSRARFGFETALEQWPENERAAEGLQETRFDYAKTAFDRGDLDLALSLIDESDEQQKELGASILQAIVDRDARQQQLRRLRRISLVASLVVAVVSIGAAVWINSERSKALVAQQEEAAQREIAERNEKEAQQQRQLAEAERTKAVAAQREEAAQRLVADREREKATAAEANARREAENTLRNLKVAERNAYYSDMLLLRQAWVEASNDQFTDLLGKYRDRDDLRGFEWDYWDRLRQTELATLTGHMGSVFDVQFSPDGTRLASAGADRTVKLRDVATGKVLLTLSGHTDRVNRVSFSPDGTRLASASKDGTVKVWNLLDGQETHTSNEHTGEVWAVSFNSHGTLLASAGEDQTVKIWDARTGEVTATLSGHTNVVYDVSFSPDGKRLVSAGSDFTVRLWDAATGRETQTLKSAQTGQAKSIGFSPDGAWLAVGYETAIVHVWDTASGEELRTLTGHTGFVTDVSFNADGTRLASASWDETVKLWDAATGREIVTFKGHRSAVAGISFSPDMTRLASASWDSTVKVWDVAEREESLTLTNTNSRVNSISLSPDGMLLASGTVPGYLTVFDAVTGHERQSVKGGYGIQSVSFSPDGVLLASAGYDKTVTIRDVATMRVKRVLAGHTDVVRSVSFSPDGTKLVSGSNDKTIKVWDTSTGEELQTLQGHTYHVLDVAFSAGGTRLASASGDSIIKLWDTDTWQNTQTLGNIKSNALKIAVSFSPDGKLLASGENNGRVILWDVLSGEKIRELSGHSIRVKAVVFSPDGKRLASSSSDGTARVWDVATGHVTLTLKDFNASVEDIAFSPDGTRLVTADGSGKVKIWDTRPWTPQLKTEQQARGYLKIRREYAKSLEELQTYIRDDKTISEEVRQQCLDWSEQFWKNR